MLLTTKEAAAQLRRTKSCLEAWRSRGGGPVYVKMGRGCFYRDTDLEQFILTGLRSNTSQKECCGRHRQL